MGAHYYDLQVALYCAVWYRNEDSRHYTKASFGMCDYDPIITAVINYNRAFKKLLDIKEHKHQSSLSNDYPSFTKNQLLSILLA